MTDATSARQDGSALIEVLVGFVILAGVIAMSFQVLSGGVRRLAAVEPRLNAIAVARSELARLSSLDALEAGTMEGGTASGTRWKIILTSLPLGAPGWTVVRPFRAQVWVGDGGEKDPLLDAVVFLQQRAP